MVDINVEYEGDLHCTANHGPSAAVLGTDAPVDNNGKGQSFSPTDLVATGLGTCMATVMGILARKEGWAIDGTRVHVKKHMTVAPPRRIARLAVRVAFPEVARLLPVEARHALEHAANTCPVRLSLLEGIEVPIDYVWE